MTVQKASSMNGLPSSLEISLNSNVKPEQILQDIGQIMNVAWGLGKTGIIIAALELKVFDHLAQGYSTPEDIAQKLDADQQGIKLLLESLVELEFISKKEGNNYIHNQNSLVYFVEDSPLYIGHMWKVHKYLNWKIWDKLSDSIKTGKPIENLFSFQGSQTWEVIIPYLNSLAKPISLYIIDLLNLRAKGKNFSILDVGCGSGIYGQTFAQSNLNIKVVGIDQGNVLQIAQEQSHKLGVEKQVEYVSGDFTQINFGESFDLILFSNIFHGFDRQTNLNLMNKAFSALKNGGIIVINEFSKEEINHNLGIISAILSLQFYLIGQGKVYNFDEYKEWLNLSGFADVQHYPISGFSSIIVGTKSAIEQ